MEQTLEERGQIKRVGMRLQKDTERGTMRTMVKSDDREMKKTMGRGEARAVRLGL